MKLSTFCHSSLKTVHFHKKWFEFYLDVCLIFRNPFDEETIVYHYNPKTMFAKNRLAEFCCFFFSIFIIVGTFLFTLSGLCSDFAFSDPDSNTSDHIQELQKLSEANSNVTSSRSSSLIIDHKLRALLEDFYSPFNNALVDLLQDSRFDWGY